MIARLFIAVLLLGHAAIHAGYLSPRPPATAGGPAWPFELSRSWLLDPAGINGDARQLLGLALVAATAGGFALAALAALGVVPIGAWAPALVTGSLASIALLVVFFHPWLVVGLLVDALVLWAALVAHWQPEGLA